IEAHGQMADEVRRTRLRIERRDRLRQLQQQGEDLGRRAVEMRALAAAVTRATQAKPVVGAVRTLAISEASLKRAESSLTAARARVEPHLRDRSISLLREAATSAREVVGSLSAATQIESGLAGREVEARDLRAELQRAQSDLGSTVALLKALPHAIEAHDGALTEARRLLALLAGRVIEAERARERLESATAHAGAMERVAERESVAAAALDAVRRGEASLAHLRQRRIDDIAGELGLTLVSGEACPVCGAFEHPEPARPTDDAVTPAQVTTEETRVARLRELSTARVDDLAMARAEVRELAARAEGLSVEKATAAAEAAADALAESERAEDDVAAGSARLTELREREASLRAARTELASSTARLDQAVADLAARLEREHAEVDTARDGHPSVAERRSTLSGAASAIDHLIDTLGSRDTAKAAVAEDEAARDSDLAASGFDSVAQWLAADRSQEWIQAQQREIEQFETACTQVQAGLSGPELADVQLDALFDDIEQLESLEKASKKDMEASSNEHGGLRDQLTRARKRVVEISEALRRNAEVIAATADAVRVGQLVAGGGENQLRLDLANYVLIRRFAEVLGAANTELARFSGGRYSLEHSDARKGNLKSGLGVRVHDMQTNQVRDVGTLSGGETFYVSLSLALALAEVVRAESGGVDLGTLFVDEGFGTLDPDVLDDVMHTLEGLRAGGRTVGIVSHVTELKSRVADRIEVIVRPDHTSTLRITA
ncbi:MAG: SMC family ATPase, partial [Terracoccus sp.]